MSTQDKIRALMHLVSQTNALALDIARECDLADEATEFSQWPEILVIQHAVCNRYKLHQDIMTARTKHATNAQPRQIAMALCYELTRYGKNTVGKCFKRDPGTVIHAIKAVKNRTEVDKGFLAEYDDLRSRASTMIAGLRAA